MRDRPRILFVEDEASISEPFSGARREGFEPVVAAHRRRGARAAPSGPSPTSCCSTSTLPDGDGRDVCRELRRASDVPIMMLTARGTETDRVVGLELGADDYVVKPFSGAEVIARIRAVLRRAQRAAPAAPAEPIAVGGLRVDLAARRARPRRRRARARAARSSTCWPSSSRNAGKVVTREDLMARVWDENWFGSTKTLDVHIGWLRAQARRRRGRRRATSTPSAASASGSPRRTERAP